MPLLLLKGVEWLLSSFWSNVWYAWFATSRFRRLKHQELLIFFFLFSFISLIDLAWTLNDQYCLMASWLDCKISSNNCTSSFHLWETHPLENSEYCHSTLWLKNPSQAWFFFFGSLVITSQGWQVAAHCTTTFVGTGSPFMLFISIVFPWGFVSPPVWDALRKRGTC